MAAVSDRRPYRWMAINPSVADRVPQAGELLSFCVCLAEHGSRV